MKKPLLYMHLAVLLWGFTGVLGRAITLEAPALVWYRMLLTCLIVLVILLIKKRSLRVSRRSFFQLALIGILMALHWIAFYGSIKSSNASIALVCLGTASIFVSLLDPLLNRKSINRNEFLIGFLALVGVYLIYSFQKLYFWGILFGIAAAALSALFTVLNKRIANEHPPRVMIFYEMGTGLLFITLLAPLLIKFLPSMNWVPVQISWASFFHDFPAALSQPNDWVWLIVLALCCTVWAQSLALMALRSISSFTATLSVNLEPIYGVLLAMYFYKEHVELGIGFYVGMGFIMASVFLQMYLGYREKQGKNKLIRFPQ